MRHRECFKTRLVHCLSALAITSSTAVGAVHHVDPNGRDGAFTSIQAAIAAADSHDEVIVSPGTYLECIDFKGKAIRLASSGGPKLTIIDAAGKGHVVQCVNGEDPNTVFDGFTITRGGMDDPNRPGHRGGGMLNVGSSPTVMNCIFTANRARHGAGMYNQDARPIISNCLFTQNGPADDSCSSRGAGMLNLNSSPVVTGCTFTGNTAGSGGGMYNYRSSPVMTDCTFSHNTAVRWGGAICNVVDSRPTVRGCTIADNRSTAGGGIFNDIRSAVNTADEILQDDASGRSALPGVIVITCGDGVDKRFASLAVAALGGGTWQEIGDAS